MRMHSHIVHDLRSQYRMHAITASFNIPFSMLRSFSATIQSCFAGTVRCNHRRIVHATPGPGRVVIYYNHTDRRKLNLLRRRWTLWRLWRLWRFWRLCLFAFLNLFVFPDETRAMLTSRASQPLARLPVSNVSCHIIVRYFPLSGFVILGYPYRILFSSVHMLVFTATSISHSSSLQSFVFAFFSSSSTACDIVVCYLWIPCPNMTNIINALDDIWRDEGSCFTTSGHIVDEGRQAKGKVKTFLIRPVHWLLLPPRHKLYANGLPNHQRFRKILACRPFNRWRLSSSIQTPCPPRCYGDENSPNSRHVGSVNFGDVSDVFSLLKPIHPVKIMPGQLDGAAYLPFQPELAKPTISVSTTKASGRNHTRAAPPTSIASRKGSRALLLRDESGFVQGNENNSHIVYRPLTCGPFQPLTAAMLGEMTRELEETKGNKSLLYWAVTNSQSQQNSSPTSDTPKDGVYDCEVQSLPGTNFETLLSQATTTDGNGSGDTKSLSEDVILSSPLSSSFAGGEKSVTKERKKYASIIVPKPPLEKRPVISADGHLVLDYSKLDGKCDCAKEILLERTRVSICQ